MYNARSPSPDLPALTSVRFLAALTVVGYHYGIAAFPFNVLPALAQGGHMAVEFFFVLSGFIMVFRYGGGGTISYTAYIRKRVARIGPLHWTLIATAFARGAWLHCTDRLIYDAIANLLFLQSFFKDVVYWYNLPSWSISVEWAFYILFPLALPILKWRPLIFLITACFLYVAARYCLVRYSHVWTPGTAGISPYHPIFYLGHFGMGMCGAWYYTSARHLPLMLRASWIALLPATLVFLYPNALLSVFLHTWLILLLAVSPPKWLCWSPLVYLGSISYGIYLLQTIAFHRSAAGLPGTGQFYLTVILLIAMAAASYHLLERPVGRFLANR